jgi:SAM-dependent methyltransferase
MTRPQLSWDELTDHYPDEYYVDRMDEFDPEEGSPSQANHLLSPLLEPSTLLEDSEPGRLLEIGCGTGEVLAYLESQGWDCVGVEPSTEAADIARDKYGLTVHSKRFDEVSFEPATFDLVLLDNVLEHLHHPFSTLDTCRTLLQNDGTLVVEVPNVRSIGFKLFGRYWSDLDVPRHLYHFSPRTLVPEVEKLGYQLDRISYSGYPITLRYSLNRFLDANGLNKMGRWVSLPLLPISLLGRYLQRGDRMRLRFTKEPVD